MLHKRRHHDDADKSRRNEAGLVDLVRGGQHVTIEYERSNMLVGNSNLQHRVLGDDPTGGPPQLVALPGSGPLLEEAILDRLPYPFLDQSLGHIRYASAVGSELGQLVQVPPGCQGKCNRSAIGIGHGRS
jgi:hypothetical protein